MSRRSSTVLQQLRVQDPVDYHPSESSHQSEQEVRHHIHCHGSCEDSDQPPLAVDMQEVEVEEPEHVGVQDEVLVVEASGVDLHAVERQAVVGEQRVDLLFEDYPPTRVELGEEHRQIHHWRDHLQTVE